MKPIYSEAKIKINMVKYNLTFINHGITSLIVVFGSFVITKKGNYRRTLLSFALPTRKKPKELLNYFHLPSDMLLIRIILSNHYLACVISKSIHNIHEMVNVVLSVLIEISVKHDITRVFVFDFRRSAVFWSICKKYSQL